ncbi:MAG TPA: hypothetical protein DEH22_04035, partial [Chloroflexi bacterium]|nr:hypothetical protein [Chloroflexota bacterium]
MKRTTIPARPDHANKKKRFTKDITVVLGDDIENDYDVVDKDFPDGLPDFWVDPDDQKQENITWISNFGLKNKAGKFDKKLPNGKKYTVELPAVSGKLVYHDGTSVQKL